MATTAIGRGCIDWSDLRRLHREIGLVRPFELEAAHAAQRQHESAATILMTSAAESRSSLQQTRGLTR